MCHISHCDKVKFEQTIIYSICELYYSDTKILKLTTFLQISLAKNLQSICKLKSESTTEFFFCLTLSTPVYFLNLCSFCPQLSALDMESVEDSIVIFPSNQHIEDKL